MKLDVKGRKILYELYKNCRTTSSQIAKVVGLSREAVDYRINVMEKEGVIRQYITLVDTPRLGYLTYNVYINLQDCDDKDEEEIKKYLVTHEFTKWVASCSGKWDLTVAFAAKDTSHLNEMLYQLTSKFQNKIKFYDILSTLSIYKDADISLVIREIITNPKKGFPTVPPQKLHKLDETDLKILSHLSENARSNVVDIAKKIKLTPEGTSYRIKKMVNEGLIRGFRAVIDITKLGHLWYMLLIETAPLPPAIEAKLETFCQMQKNIFFTDKLLGKWQIRVEILADDHQHLNRVMRDIRNTLSQYLRSYELVIVFDELKQVSFTKGMMSVSKEKV